jgi:prephenate dehydrogenase
MRQGEKNRNLKKIGIIGFGRFGRLMASYLVQDFDVWIHDRKDQTDDIRKMGAHPADFAAACGQEVVIPAVPISQLKPLLENMTPYLQSGALVADVCSVKLYPVEWMEAILPQRIFILATHPMFGPDSAADSLKNHKIFLHPVRMEPEYFRKIKAYLQSKGLILIQSSPEEHDREIAVSLSLTHFIGRTLADFGAAPLKIDTEGYKRLLHILEVVENDTWQLFSDMHRYNPFANQTLLEFMEAGARVAGSLEK